jgi:TonB-linked SusC/RagA family outer membrane protein
MNKLLAYAKHVAGTILLFLLSSAAFSQNRLIKGLVKDQQNIPLPGITVNVKGSNNSVATDAKGVFSITVAPTATTLVFSSIGFKTQETPITASGEILISLEKDNAKLQEVVVVGYGIQKRANLTGAVDQIGSEYFEDRPIPNAVQALQGAMPNLNIQISDGKPIRNPAPNIRGATSIGAGGQALVLIDGVQGNLIDINPNDIESVTTLKDASSAAIYGARGAFGVVLVTTKRPGKNAAKITYSGNYSIKQRTSTPNWVSDGYTWSKYFNESYLSWTDYVQAPKTVNTFFPFSPQYLDELKQRHDNPGTLPDITTDPATGNYVYYGNTDWLDLLYKDNIPTMEHSLNISGANDKLDYVISGRYYKQDGIFRYNSDDLDKFNFRIKGGIQAKKWLRFTNNTDVSAFKYYYPLQAINQYDVWTNLKLYGFPMAKLLNPDGTLTQAAANNGVGELYYGKSRSTRNQLYLRNTTGFAINALNNKLNIKGDFTYTYTANTDERRLAPVPFSAKPGVITIQGANSLNNNSDKTHYYAANLYGDYTEHFGDHTVKLLVGGNYERNNFRNLEVQRDELILNDLTDFNLAVGQNYKIAGGASEWAVLGAFARLNYDYKNRYLLDVVSRYDGASKFPSSEQYGFFPSISAGWNVAEENFMEGTRRWLDAFKIRGSYGSLGNSQISPYMYEQSISATRSGLIINGVNPTYLTMPSVLPEGFTWETSTTLDFGVDVELLNRRLSISYDWYQRKTTDMIIAGRPLPAVFGAAVPKGNYADLTTKGFELTVNWNDKFMVAGKPMTYGVRAILSDNVATIDKFYNPTNLITTYYPGMKLGDIYGYVADGLFQSQEEINKKTPDQSGIVVSTGNILQPGDLKFKDLDGNNKIDRGKNTLDDMGDQKVIGNSTPRYTYGFTTNWSWNNISLSAFFQGVGKRDWYPGNESGIFWGQYTRWYGQIPQHTIEGTWLRDDPQPNSYFPRYRGPMIAGGRELGYPVDRYLQNIAYIRLKDVTIGYTLPTKLVQKAKFQSVRVYVSGQNLWTYSPMFKLTKDIDPEVIEGSDPEIRSDMGQGAAYPMLKTYTFGINFTF